MALKTLTLSDIRSLKPKPCYDPSCYAPEDWTGTVVDILRAARVPAADRLWVALKLLDDRTNRLFAVWCARTAIARYWPNPDPRFTAACDVAERYANGQATSDELTAANAAAGAAYAAGAAAYAAARREQIDHLIEMLEQQT